VEIYDWFILVYEGVHLRNNYLLIFTTTTTASSSSSTRFGLGPFSGGRHIQNTMYRNGKFAELVFLLVLLIFMIPPLLKGSCLGCDHQGNKEMPSLSLNRTTIL
jgi:hypothetical protein